MPQASKPSLRRCHSPLPALALALLALAVATTAEPVFDPEAVRFFEQAVTHQREGDMVAAIIELKNALQREPKMLAGWVKLSEIYLSLGDAADAVAAVERAAALGADRSLTLLPRARAYLLRSDIDALLKLAAPGDAAADMQGQLLLLQARGLLEAHRPRDAAEYFTRAREVLPEDPAPLQGLVAIALQEGRRREAAQLLEAALVMDDRNAESWYLQGNLHRMQARPAAALNAFERALVLAPGHGPARLGRAALQIDAGRAELAVADVRAVLAANPDSFQALYLGFLAHGATGDSAGAEDMLERARTMVRELPAEVLEQNLPAQLISAVLALRDGAHDRARDLLARYLQRMPGNDGARRFYASALLRAGQAALARAEVRKLLERRPDDPNLLWMMASALGQLGEHEQARVLLETLYERGIRSAQTRLQMGVASLATGDRERAIAELEAATLQAETPRSAGTAGLLAAMAHVDAGNPRQALTLVDGLLARAPDNPAWHNLAGALQLMLGDRGKARAAFNAALVHDPGFVPARLNLAEMDRQAGRLESAEAAYRAILASDGKRVDALRGLAEVALADQRVADAIGHLETIKRLDRSLVADRLALAKALVAAGRLPQAQAELAELRAESSDNWQVLLLAAGVEQSLFNDAVANAYLRQAAAVADSPAAFVQIAEAYAARGLVDQAIANLRIAVADWPTAPAARVALAGMLSERGDHDAAREQAQALIDARPDAPEGWITAGRAALAAGRPEVALAHFDQALSLVPVLDAVLGRSDALLRLERADDAVAGFQAWAQRQPLSLRARTAFAALLLKAGRLAEAASQYDRILEQAPRNRTALNNRAWLAHELGQPEAVALARHAASIWPNDPAVLDTAGRVMLEAGELKDALWYLRDALARDSADPRIKVNLARVLAAEGKQGEAMELLADALREPLFPGRESAATLLERLGATGPDR